MPSNGSAPASRHSKTDVPAYFNDPEYLARVGREAAGTASPGPTLGAWDQAGQGLMRGGVMAADAARMAAAVPVVAFGDDEEQDAYFAATDDVLNSAMAHWTPDPRTTTLAGRVMGGVAEAVLPLVAAGGHPGLLMAASQTRTSTDLIDQGVDASTARDVGMVDALAIGAGFMIPAFGNTLARRLAFGAASNPAIGAATTAIQGAALNEAGAHEAAAQYNPYDLEARGIDAALGFAFGGIAHAGGAKAPPLGRALDVPGATLARELDAILTYRGAQRWDSRVLGEPTIANRNAHDTAMRSAMGALIRDEPVNIERSPVGAVPTTPTLDPQAIGAEIAADVFREAPKKIPTIVAKPEVQPSVIESVSARTGIPPAAPAILKQARTRTEAAAERYAIESRIDTTRDDLLAAIAKEGGISREAAEAAGIDPAEFGRKGWRIKNVFTNKGASLEAMSEKLASRGYHVTDAGGYGENPMLAALDRALRGERVQAPEGLERHMAEQVAEREAAQTYEPALADEEYAGLHTTDQQRLLDAVERARDAGVPIEDLEAITELGGIHGYQTQDIIRIVDEEAAQRGRAASGGGGAEEPRSGAGTDTAKGDSIREAKPAGDDIDLALVDHARDLATLNPDQPIQLPDELGERPLAEAMADADREVLEAETTYARAAKAAAGCLLG